MRKFGEQCSNCNKAKFEKNKKSGICFKNINNLQHVIDFGWCENFKQVIQKVKVRR